MIYNYRTVNYSSDRVGGRRAHLKTRWMARFGRKSGIDDALLVEAIERAEEGLIDANLGGGVIMQRVGRPGQGRSGGCRTLIAFRVGDKAVFVYGFAKNERDNVDPHELQTIKDLARQVLGWSDAQFDQAKRDGRIEEIRSGKQG